MHRLRSRLQHGVFSISGSVCRVRKQVTEVSLDNSRSVHTSHMRFLSTDSKFVTTSVMEGHTLADNIQDDVFARSVYMTERLGRPPKLAVVLVGGRDDSRRYIQVKQRAARAVGIDSVVEELKEDIDMFTLLSCLHRLNGDTSIDGIIIQLPLPPHLSDSVALQSVVPNKDVDGFHLNNQAHLLDPEQCSRVIFPLHTSNASNISSNNLNANDSDSEGSNNPSQNSNNNNHYRKTSSEQQSLYSGDQTLASIEQQRPTWLPALEPSFFSSIWSYQSFSTLNFRVDLQQVTKTLLPFKETPLLLTGDAMTELPPQTLASQFTSPQLPCTPQSCLALLDHYQIPLKGSHVVVLGRSTVVGFPQSLMLMHRGAVVTNVDKHSEAELRRKLCLQADIIVSAVGCAGIVDKDCVKPGAVVLDVGINFVQGAKKATTQYSIPERRWEKLKPGQASKGPSGSKLVGDADFDSLVDHAGMITPVPGGVGPVTVAMLLRNTVTACEYNNRQMIRAKKV